VAILQNPEVSDAEPRRTISGQIKAGPVQWRNLILFVVHDYGNIRVSRLVPESGAWPPATGEILIERDAFQVAKAKIGDAVRVKTANGVEQPLVISGSVHDVGQAQARMENIVYGYISLATLAQLGEQPTLNQRSQIARIYFGQALFLGIAAVIVSVPLGIIRSRALCRYMAYFLNFDINSFAVPFWVYAAIALVGIAAPLIAAALPVLRGTGVPVRVALSNFGLSQTSFGASALDRALTRIGGTFSLIILALRNSFRRRVRVGLTLLTLTAGGLFFMLALNVHASMINTLDHMFAARKFDLSISFANPYEVEKIERAVRNTPGVKRAEGWFITEGSLDNRFSVVALPPETQLLDLEIIEGRNLAPGEVHAIVVNNALAGREPKMRVGETVVLRIADVESTWHVVGIAREAFAPAEAYVPLSFMQQLYPGRVNGLRLGLVNNDWDAISVVRTDLDRNLEQQGVRARGSSSTSESRFAFDEHMLMIYVFLIVMSAIIGGVGGLGLMTTMSLNVFERRREMGVMRALGATPRIVWLMIVAEGVVIGVLSWIIAALLAWPISKAIGNLLVRVLFRSGLDFTFEPVGLLIWMLVSIGLSALASFVPAWKASRVTVREALAYE
jgi:putative ABC transport system permease protein